MENVPRTALVTGAARRIGRVIAKALAADGWAVGVHFHRSEDKAASLVAEIAADGGRAVALRADLSDEAATADLALNTERALGPVGVLINNASVFFHDGIADATRQSWDAHIETNLRAPFVLIQQMARRLPADCSGCVVNILDQRVWNLTPSFLSYTVSKSALWTLTRTLAMALAPRIRVNAIGPGPTLKNERQTQDHFVRQHRAVPLQRRTEPSEIAAAVEFLLSAPAMTGQMIALDGGEHLGWAQPSRGVVPKE